MTKRPYTTFEIYKRLSDANMEHKHAVAIAESIGEFVEEREQAIRAELSSKYLCKDEMAHAERTATPPHSPGFFRTTALMLANDRPFALMMTSTAILWAVLIWDAISKR